MSDLSFCDLLKKASDLAQEVIDGAPGVIEKVTELKGHIDQLISAHCAEGCVSADPSISST
jgi:hypothetical protein